MPAPGFFMCRIFISGGQIIIQPDIPYKMINTDSYVKIA